LVDSISPSLTAVERAQLYAAIGSGESYSAITAVSRAGTRRFSLTRLAPHRTQRLAYRLPAQRRCTPPLRIAQPRRITLIPAQQQEMLCSRSDLIPRTTRHLSVRAASPTS
jgi:hypothetical protein